MLSEGAAVVGGIVVLAGVTLGGVGAWWWLA
jgi:hypothetical protein